MKLNLPPISQNFSRWASKKLGTSTVTTIGSHGCVLCGLTMIVNYFKHETDPAKLNDDLVRAKGFVNGNLVVWGAINQIYSDIQIDWDNYIECADVPAPLEKIDNLLAGRIPVLVKVDFSPAAGLQDHWVLIKGKNGDYLINDPWTGEEYFFTAKYGDPVKNIYKIVAYKGDITYEPSCEDKILELEIRNKSLNEELARTRLEVNCLGDLLKNETRDNNDLHKELKALYNSRHGLEFKLRASQEGAESLQKGIDSATQEIIGLKEALVALQTKLEAAEAGNLTNFTNHELLLALVKRILRK